jgi:hypothetical protein
MAGFSAAVDRLTTALGRLPGIGAKSAERLAHHLLKCPPEEAIELAEAIRGTSPRPISRPAQSAAILAGTRAWSASSSNRATS